MENPLQNQGINKHQSRTNIVQHSTSQGGLDKNMAQVTALGDSPTDYVAAGTRSGDFMGVPKTKASAQGNEIDNIFYKNQLTKLLRKFRFDQNCISFCLLM